MCKEYFEEVSERLDKLTDEEFIKLIDETIDDLKKKRELKEKGFDFSEYPVAELFYSEEYHSGKNPLAWARSENIK